MAEGFKSVVGKTEAARKYVGVEAEGVIRDFVGFLTARFDLGSNNSCLKLLEVRLLQGRKAGHLGLFEMTTRTTGKLSVYVNRIGDDLETLMKVVAHEFVHAKQWAYGELQYVPRLSGGALNWCYLWAGSPYDEMPSEYEEYMKSPWEQEAFGLQDALVEAYKASKFLGSA